MAFWDTDLTTRMGAETATGQAGVACFVLAGFRIVALLFFGGMVGLDNFEGLFLAGMTGLEALMAVVAGFRFRSGNGAYWGIAVAALLALSILSSLVSLAIGGVVISAIFFVIVVQGVRGALALRNTHFDDEDLEAFE
ncbi:hypothetical protein [Erythrobacter sp. Alg231-14]|uniref:hypothetical protein n=1 Tax=Erythrobacter sp. Alg231-14 TaxID=1922225 RepID=UPI00307BD56C